MFRTVSSTGARSRAITISVSAAAMAAGTLIAVVPAATAVAATAPTCGTNVRSATLSHTAPATVTGYSRKTPTGAPLKTTTLALGAHFYTFTAGGKLVFGRNTFTVSRNATVRLMCAAPSAARTLNYPRVALFAGTVSVHTTLKHSGEIVVPEALLTPNPSGPYRLAVTVTRKPVSTSLTGMMYWLNNYTNQPRGVATITSKPGLDVTPYVGKRVGDCRYSTTKAILSSKGAKGYGRTAKGGNAGGSATYWQGSHRVP
jgi:hypothetical protein